MVRNARILVWLVADRRGQEVVRRLGRTAAPACRYSGSCPRLQSCSETAAVSVCPAAVCGACWCACAWCIPSLWCGTGGSLPAADSSPLAPSERWRQQHSTAGAGAAQGRCLAMLHTAGSQVRLLAARQGTVMKGCDKTGEQADRRQQRSDRWPVLVRPYGRAGTSLALCGHMCKHGAAKCRPGAGAEAAARCQ